MRKSYLTVLLFLLGGYLFAQEQIINSFDAEHPDTNYWQYFDNQGGQHYQTSENADSALGWMVLTYPSDNVAEGTGAMSIEYSAQNIESWGGYTKLEHWNPDSNGVYDWSMYDTVSFWYNNVVPQSESGRVHVRFNIHDASNSPNGYNVYDVGEVEYYYSFEYILDSEPGWHRWDIPLVNNANWDGLGFNLTGWAGITGNSVLDKDKIKGFSLEFSINGGGEGDYVTGQILFDKLHLRGVSEKPWLIFNGKTVNPALGAFTWGQSSLELVEGGGIDPATNALLWTQGDEWANGWSGAGWNVDPPMDLGFRWPLDSLRFALKADAGTNSPIRVQFESPNGAWGSAIDITADDQWHVYAIALADFYNTDGAKPDWDSTNITVVQFMGEGNATAGKKLYFDYIWTGSPVIDVIAPEAPALVTAAGGEYVNLITWTDVPGETGEVYDIYYSTSPITDVTDPGLEMVESSVGENIGFSEHVLRAPVMDQEVTYYYAVVCTDASGNVGALKAADASVTNTAQGVTVINPAAPPSFVADGDLTEWAGIAPFRMYPEDGTGNVVTNTSIDGNADLSVDAYVAMDAEYLYFAFDVEDDIFSNDHATSYLRDGCDLFIGLYDWRGPSHISYELGDEPDYHFRFVADSAMFDQFGGLSFAYPNDGNYAFVEKFPSGYAIEGRVSFAQIAAASEPDAALFTPVVGKRIKIDYSINDADATGEREGIMCYSQDNEDQSWRDVFRWTYTWIGDQFVDVDENGQIPLNYELSQNYPNPFNPSTIIKYSVVQKGNVSLKVYNLLGQEVATLVNKVHAPGAYEINFDASELATGMYIYQIQAGSFVTSKKMLLIK